MDGKNNLGRLLALLVVSLVLCLAMFYLPGEMRGYTIKKVDLLSDLRVEEETVALDSLLRRLESEAVRDTLAVDSVALRDSLQKVAGIDSAAVALRDSLFRVISLVEDADSAGMRIEDYSVGHIGLKRFFEALAARDSLQRPVYVAFLGDSFIEGDILVANFRSDMQQKFGGRGVGFVPASSVAERFRPTVEQHSEGWKTWSMMNNEDHEYTLSGMLFEPENGDATLSLKTTNRYPKLEEVSSFKVFYEKNKNTMMSWTENGSADTLRVELSPTDTVTVFEREGAFRSLDFRFAQRDSGFLALGVALEDNSGVVVDNYSLRGNSGQILYRLDSAQCHALNSIRPYDLIVLQYGLNVASDGMMQYDWYARRMEEAIRQVRRCFPQADILLLGVSDRSRQINGRFETMPAVLALLHTQRQMARKMGITFWNVFGAMGGENSMVEYVEKNWASKDYTHLGFRGGKELADALFKALMKEKTFYDEAAKAGY